jgi:hypothetical protein
MEFIEAPAFTHYVADYLDGDEYRELQSELARNPEAGDLMPGTGGFRKMRWGDPRRGKERRGGLRIIYYYFLSDQQVWLMTLYGKNEAADRTPKEKKTLKNEIEKELREREMKRQARRVRVRRTW